MRFLEHDEADDPILSVVNLIDLFLVVIGFLMIVIAGNPLDPFSTESVTVIENPGEVDMRITVKEAKNSSAMKPVARSERARACVLA